MKNTKGDVNNSKDDLDLETDEQNIGTCQRRVMFGIGNQAIISVSFRDFRDILTSPGGVRQLFGHLLKDTPSASAELNEVLCGEIPAILIY